MEVVQVCPLFFPYLGGVETHVMEISKRLIEFGLDVKVYTTDPSGKLPKQEDVCGIEVHRLKSFAPNGIYYFSPGLYFKLRKSKQARIIHAHSFPDFPSLAAALARGANKKPIVFTPHYWGSSHVIGSSIWRTLAKNGYNLLLGKRMFSKFDAIVSISEFERGILIRKFGLDERRIAYIPNGVDVEKIKESTRGKNCDGTILYVGRLEKYKGVNFLINAFHKIKASFPEARLVVVGKGSYKNELVSLADNSGDRNSIEFLEDLTEKDLMRLYLSSSLFVTLSQYEALPVALLEAMAHGLPAIATRVGGVPEIIQPGKTGLVLDFPPDEKMLVKMIKSLLDNPEYANEIGGRAKKTILSRFSWDSVARKILDLYNEILWQD